MNLGTVHSIIRRIKQPSQIHLSAKLLTGAMLLGSVVGCGEQSSEVKDESAAAPIKAETAQERFLIGSYTDEPGQGVYGVSINSETGELTDLGLMAETNNPSYVAIAEDGDMLYTLYTVNEKREGGVSAFSWNDEAGRFTLKAETQGVGFSPCHITLGPDGKLIAVANYMSSDVQLFSREESANLALLSAKKHEGKGPHSRQEAPHPHWVGWSPDGKYVYTVDLGLDQVIKYTVNGTELSEGKPAVTLQGGDGPRHMAFHGTKNFAYLLNELSNTVVVLNYDPATGALTESQRVATLDPNFTEHSQAAAIKISPDQRFVYASNRGAHTIAVFAIGEMGQLTYVHEHSVEGEWPRDFTITEAGDFVIVANEHSSNLVVLARDQSTGKLSSTGHNMPVHRPTAVVKF